MCGDGQRDGALTIEQQVEKPLLREAEGAEQVKGQTDVIEKAAAIETSEAAQSESVDQDAIEKAEELAVKEQRSSVPASSVGWKQIGDWEEKDKLTAEDELIDLATPTLLDSYLPEKLYGDWYHSVAILIGSGLLSFVVGWLKLSIAPVFFIFLASTVYYRTSMKKYRGLIRDQIQKEFTISKIENEYETMDWLNTFLDKYWIYLEPSVSQIVAEQVNPILAAQESIPKFVKSIWIDEFTLGIKPPRIDAVKTLVIPKDDVVVMDWAVSYTPHATADISAKQFKNYVNQRVVVKAKVFGITVPVSIENISFKSFIRVRFKMMSSFPHIQTVSISLMEPPEFDFIAKLLGESIFNWELLSIPGLYPLINEMVKKFAGPMLIKPFSFQLNVPQLLSGANTSVGVLTLNIKHAKGLKAADRVLGNTIDPYLTFSYDGKEVLSKTKTIENTFTPVWNETISVLVSNFTDPLIITVFDYNDDRKDKNMGSLQLDLNTLYEKASATNVIGKFLRNSKPVGELFFDYEFSPTLEEVRLADGTVQPPPDLNTGLTKIEFSEIRNVKVAGANEKTKLTCFAEIYLNNVLIKKSPIIKNNNNPNFNLTFESIITDRRISKIKVLIKDAKGKLIAGCLQSLDNLIDRTEIDNLWIPFSKGEGEFKISAVWKSVELKNVPGSAGYHEPIGVLRVLFNKAENLRNLEKVGKSDPYGRITINGIEKGRTDFLKGNLDPVWNEAVYVPISSPNQKVTLEVMDVERSGIDRTLGSFNIKLDDIVNKDDQDKYVEYVDSSLRTGRLIHRKGPKGIVTYGLSFYPILPVKTLQDYQSEANYKKLEAEKKAEAAKSGDNSNKKADKKDETEEEEEFVDTNKVELSLSQLIEYNSGVFVYSVLSGEYSQADSYLQVYFDDHGYPDHTSPKIKKNSVHSPTVGDVLIKELEWSTTTFKLVKKANANRKDKSIAESTIPTLSLLKNTYEAPQILTLTGEGVNKIKIQAEWIPILAENIPPADLITNSGDLDLDIISCENLISSDSNGKSDPFVKVYLNDEEDSLYKTKVIKKTLNPTFDEKTTIEVKNRVNSVLRFKVLDWDFGAGQDDFLGTAELPLSEIDCFNARETTLKITGPKGVDGGTLKIKTSFRARYIVRLNAMDTNIGDAGLKTIGTGIGAGVGVGKSVIGGGVGVVGKVKKGIFGKHKKEED